MSAISAPRRFAVAVAGVAGAAVLFHADVASALITRGDDVLRAGDVDAAVRCYARAAWLDASSRAAADRLAFTLLMRRRAGDAGRAYRAADAALRTSPRDPALLADRAFAARQSGRWRAAERDFIAAAWHARDARYAHLAARMAGRAHDRAAERAHLREALAIDPAYGPARALLARIRR